MDRVAVFVDAGYLFAAGSALLAGSKQPRSQLKLNEAAATAFLSKLATDLAGIPLLRIYWYDGTSGRPSFEQTTLAHVANVKLRLGFINNHGQQKGVDSLIVIDLIELARNHAMSDAVLISGDEDIRVGVQVAQTFGVRVHLVGIQPARGSQSKTLHQEADTTHELNSADIGSFLQVLPAQATQATATPPTTTVPAASSVAVTTTVTTTAATTPVASTDPTLKVIGDLLDPLDANDIANLKAALTPGQGVPREFDGRLLARLRDAIGRDLTTGERSQARAAFIRDVKRR